MAESPLQSSCKQKLAPVMEALDKLRNLHLHKEKISIPTIVVIGDRSSGKTSVVESLTGISLPHGEGNKLTLILRLENHTYENPKIYLEHEGIREGIENARKIPENIQKITAQLAGEEKEMKPLTLIVKKRGFMDLVLVDLPGLPTSPQSGNTYQKIKGVIKDHISSDTSIIVNVVAASADFEACEATRMAKHIDNMGKRTLSVFTKCEQPATGIDAKVLSHEANLGLGCFCVINKTKDESQHFNKFPLSNIPKSMVGVPALAEKLVTIMSHMILSRLPELIQKIEESLNSSSVEKNQMRLKLDTTADLRAEFTDVRSKIAEACMEFFLRSGPFNFNGQELNWDSWLNTQLKFFSEQLQDNVSDGPFLKEEMESLKQSEGIQLPGVNWHSAFMFLLARKVTDKSSILINFTNPIWEYMEKLYIKFVEIRCSRHPYFIPPMKRASRIVISKAKKTFEDKVNSMIEMEKLTSFSSDPKYEETMNKLRTMFRQEFETKIRNQEDEFDMKDYGGLVAIGHLHALSDKTVKQAFNLKLKIVVYSKIVLKRMSDWMALELRLAIKNLMGNNMLMELEMMRELKHCEAGLLEEPPHVTSKREVLTARIALLHQLKATIGNAMP